MNAVFVTPQKELCSGHTLTFSVKAQWGAETSTCTRLQEGAPTPYPGGVRQDQVRNQDFHARVGVTRTSSPSPLQWGQRSLSGNLRLLQSPSGNEATTTAVPVKTTKKLDVHFCPSVQGALLPPWISKQDKYET